MSTSKINPVTVNVATKKLSNLPATGFEALLERVENTKILPTYMAFWKKLGSSLAPTYGNLWKILEKDHGAVQMFWHSRNYEHLDIVLGYQAESRVQVKLMPQHLIGLLNKFLKSYATKS